MPRICSPATFEPVLADAEAEVVRRSAALAAARLAGDAAGRIAQYAPDSVTMADYQPRLYGPAQAERFYAMLAARQRVSRFVQRAEERIALGADIFERGTFRIAYLPAGEAHERFYDGRYVHLWRRQSDGAFKLKAEVWGYAAHVADPAAHRLGEPAPPARATSENDVAVGLELGALNAADARSVRMHDVARIDLNAPDAVIVPFAEQAVKGGAAIRAHLGRYIAQGRGATFDSVRTWNEGHELRGGYVIEYPRFEVVWRAGGDGGIVSGSGLRVWRREADCSLRTIRQIGTHDYR